MNNADVYLYGMTVLSTIHQLKAKFPSADGYQEIIRTFVIPGGEAANGAIVLSNLGVPVTLDGCFLGDLTAEPLCAYLQKRNVDCSLLLGFEQNLVVQVRCVHNLFAPDQVMHYNLFVFRNFYPDNIWLS